MGFKDLVEILTAFIGGFALRGAIVAEAHRVEDVVERHMVAARISMTDEFRKMTAAVRLETQKLLADVKKL